MTVSSTDLYANLRRALDPSMKAASYKRLKGSRPAWSGALGNKVVVVHFAVSQSGWSAAYGSQFTLNFDLHDKPVAYNSAHLKRLGKLLSPEDLELVRELDNAVLKSLPGPRRGDPLSALPADVLLQLKLSHSPRAAPYSAGQDIWMHYYSLDDVATWARFLEPRMVSMASAYIAGLSSDGS